MKAKSGKQAVFEDVLNTITKYFVVLVILVLILICLSGIKFVESGNVAIILRFGQVVGDSYEEQVHQPGLLLAFPYIIDEVIMVPTGQVKQQYVMTHYTDSDLSTFGSYGYVITGDQNIAVLGVSVKYIIENPVQYALNVKDPEKIINACVSNAMLQHAAKVSVDYILTSGKGEYGENILEYAQEKLDLVGSGIKLNTVEFTDVSMPGEVRLIYEGVQTAVVQAETELENAENYKESTIPQARAQADTLIGEASSLYSQSVSAANTELAEFWGVLEEYDKNPEAVRIRLFAQKISEAISNIGEVKVVKDGNSKIFVK